ncbi:hypothetical protein HF086_010486 [Spodoptera exigua]|uniref:Longin domain-containing protein n=1 Tax=Spodoptera exigua TaxID=7107 RepID=A0A922SLW8_SPOEX|nr:hypothetical protein HF086_010486 [Spodoptera exigua]
MVLMTMIARVVDGLPLAATMQEDEQSGCNVLEYQNQAKMLFRKLGPQSPTRCSIETGPYLFHYLIEHEICYLVLCERNYSKRLAFSYLEEIAQEFYQQYGKRVNTVTRPYTFIEFDTWMQRARRQYAEGGARARRAGAAAQLGGQLGDRASMWFSLNNEFVSELDTKTQNLSMMSSKYKKDATYLNTKSMLVKVTAGAVILLVFVLYFWVL